MQVYITRIHKEEEIQKSYKDRLARCPICGSKAFLNKDVVDGFYFGYSVGCPRYCFNDGIHGQDENTTENEHLTIFGLNSKEECVEKWNERVEYVKGRMCN